MFSQKRTTIMRRRLDVDRRNMGVPVVSRLNLSVLVVFLATFRIADRWALYTLASLGLSLAHFNDKSPILSGDGMPIRRNYFGGRAGLALGARYRVNKISGLFFEISGSVHALDDGPGGLKNREFNEPYMARLMLNMGFVFGFAFEGSGQAAVLAGGPGR